MFVGKQLELDNKKCDYYNRNNAMMRRVGYETSQRGAGCWKCPVGKYLKTTSEWL